jgi:hypothetical protein
VPSKDLSEPESRDPLFGAFGREVLAEHGVEIGANTRAFYVGLFDRQLAPFFGESQRSQITWSAIDRYKKERLRLVRRIEASTARGRVLRGSDNRPVRLSPRTINHSINLLSLILDEAVRRPGVALGANPARDRKLRAKVAKAKLRASIARALS